MRCAEKGTAPNCHTGASRTIGHDLTPRLPACLSFSSPGSHLESGSSASHDALAPKPGWAGRAPLALGGPGHTREISVSKTSSGPQLLPLRSVQDSARPRPGTVEACHRGNVTWGRRPESEPWDVVHLFFPLLVYKPNPLNPTSSDMPHAHFCIVSTCRTSYLTEFPFCPKWPPPVARPPAHHPGRTRECPTAVGRLSTHPSSLVDHTYICPCRLQKAPGQPYPVPEVFSCLHILPTVPLSRRSAVKLVCRYRTIPICTTNGSFRTASLHVAALIVSHLRFSLSQLALADVLRRPWCPVRPFEERDPVLPAWAGAASRRVER